MQALSGVGKNDGVEAPSGAMIASAPNSNLNANAGNPGTGSTTSTSAGNAGNNNHNATAPNSSTVATTMPNATSSATTAATAPTASATNPMVATSIVAPTTTATSLTISPPIASIVPSTSTISAIAPNHGTHGSYANDDVFQVVAQLVARVDAIEKCAQGLQDFQAAITSEFQALQASHTALQHSFADAMTDIQEQLASLRPTKREKASQPDSGLSKSQKVLARLPACYRAK
jgi:hypothetical protein